VKKQNSSKRPLRRGKKLEERKPLTISDFTITKSVDKSSPGSLGTGSTPPPPTK